MSDEKDVVVVVPSTLLGAATAVGKKKPIVKLIGENNNAATTSDVATDDNDATSSSPQVMQCDENNNNLFGKDNCCYDISLVFGIVADDRERDAADSLRERMREEEAWRDGTLKGGEIFLVLRRYMLRSPLFCAIDVPANGSCFFHAVFGAYWRNLTGDAALFNTEVRSHFAAHMHGNAPGYEPWLVFNRAARRLELSRLAPVTVNVVRMGIARSCTIAMRLYYVASTLAFPRAELVESDELRVKHCSVLASCALHLEHYRQLFFDTVGYSLALWQFFSRAYSASNCSLEAVDDTLLLYAAIQSIERHLFRQSSSLQRQMREFMSVPENLALLSVGQLQALSDAAGGSSTDCLNQVGELAQTACHVQTLDMIYPGTNVPRGFSIWTSQTAAQPIAQLLGIDIYTLYATHGNADSSLQVLFDSALGYDQRVPPSTLDVFEQQAKPDAAATDAYLSSAFIYNPNGTHYLQGRQPRFDNASLFFGGGGNDSRDSSNSRESSSRRNDDQRLPMTDAQARLLLTAAMARGLLEDDCGTVSSETPASVVASLRARRADLSSCPLSTPFGCSRDIVSSADGRNVLRESMLPHALPQLVRLFSRAQQQRGDDASQLAAAANNSAELRRLTEPVLHAVADLVGEASPRAIDVVCTSLLQVWASDFVYPCLHIDDDDWLAYESLIAQYPLSAEQTLVQRANRFNLPLDAQSDARYRVYSKRQDPIVDQKTATNATTATTSAAAAVVASPSVASEKPAPTLVQIYQSVLRYVLSKLRLFPNIPTCSVYVRYPLTEPRRWRHFVFVVGGGGPQSCAKEQGSSSARDWRTFPIVASDLRVFEVRAVTEDGISVDGNGADANRLYLESFGVVASGANVRVTDVGELSRALDANAEFVGTSLETSPTSLATGGDEAALCNSRWTLFDNDLVVATTDLTNIGEVLHGSDEDLAIFDQFDCPLQKRAARMAVMYKFCMTAERGTVLQPMPISYAAGGGIQAGADSYAVRDRAYLLAPLVRQFARTRPRLAPYAQSGDERQWVPFVFDAPLAEIVDAVLQQYSFQQSNFGDNSSSGEQAMPFLSYQSLAGCPSSVLSSAEECSTSMLSMRDVLALMPPEAYAARKAASIAHSGAVSKQTSSLSGKKRDAFASDVSGGSARSTTAKAIKRATVELRRSLPVRIDDTPLVEETWHATKVKIER